MTKLTDRHSFKKILYNEFFQIVEQKAQMPSLSERKGVLFFKEYNFIDSLIFFV